MFADVFLTVLLFFAIRVLGHSPFDESKWIWANDLTQDGKAPPGSHSFRRTFDNSGVQSPVPCIILITCDDIYHLFLNGELLGSGNQALQAQAYHAFLQPGKNVFAVNATNLLHAPNPAGLLVDVQIPYDGNDIGRIVSDSLWRAHNEVRQGFEDLDYDDNFWPHAAVVSDYGSEPWGNIKVPSTIPLGDMGSDLLLGLTGPLSKPVQASEPGIIEKNGKPDSQDPRSAKSTSNPTNNSAHTPTSSTGRPTPTSLTPNNGGEPATSGNPNPLPRKPEQSADHGPTPTNDQPATEESAKKPNLLGGILNLVGSILEPVSSQKEQGNKAAAVPSHQPSTRPGGKDFPPPPPPSSRPDNTHKSMAALATSRPQAGRSASPPERGHASKPVDRQGRTSPERVIHSTAEAKNDENNAQERTKDRRPAHPNPSESRPTSTLVRDNSTGGNRKAVRPQTKTEIVFVTAPAAKQTTQPNSKKTLRGPFPAPAEQRASLQQSNREVVLGDGPQSAGPAIVSLLPGVAAATVGGSNPKPPLTPTEHHCTVCRKSHTTSAITTQLSATLHPQAAIEPNGNEKSTLKSPALALNVTSTKGELSADSKSLEENAGKPRVVLAENPPFKAEKTPESKAAGTGTKAGPNAELIAASSARVEDAGKPAKKVAPLDVACGCPPKSNAALSLTNANWIWTNEIRGGNAPVGARAFRRELSLPRGLKATGVKILIGVDDHFTLYVQGHRVGSGEVWSAAHTFDVTLGKPTSEVVIAVDAANAEGGPAGLVADIQLVIDGCEGSPVPVASDGSWKYSVTVPKSFESIDYDDSGWSLATVEGRYGMSPWAQLSMPYGIVQSKV